MPRKSELEDVNGRERGSGRSAKPFTLNKTEVKKKNYFYFALLFLLKFNFFHYNRIISYF